MQARIGIRLALVTVFTAVLVGANSLRSETPVSPSQLPAVVVEPTEEALARRAAERAREEARRAREKAIRKAAEWYEIEPRLAERIHEAAVAEEVAPRLAFALVQVESRFDSTAVSSAGALGLTQLMPATARGVDPDVERGELFRSEPNLRIGMRYLRHLLDHYDGDRRMALTAYNRGPGTVARATAAGQEPYNGYARLVLERRVPRSGEVSE